jgi:hypothetical protein
VAEAALAAICFSSVEDESASTRLMPRWGRELTTADRHASALLPVVAVGRDAAHPADTAPTAHCDRGVALAATRAALGRMKRPDARTGSGACEGGR